MTVNVPHVDEISLLFIQWHSDQESTSLNWTQRLDSLNSICAARMFSSDNCIMFFFFLIKDHLYNFFVFKKREKTRLPNNIFLPVSLTHGLLFHRQKCRLCKYSLMPMIEGTSLICIWQHSQPVTERNMLTLVRLPGEQPLTSH